MRWPNDANFWLFFWPRANKIEMELVLCFVKMSNRSEIIRLIRATAAQRDSPSEIVPEKNSADKAFRPNKRLRQITALCNSRRPQFKLNTTKRQLLGRPPRSQHYVKMLTAGCLISSKKKTNNNNKNKRRGPCNNFSGFPATPAQLPSFIWLSFKSKQLTGGHDSPPSSSR